MSGLQGTVLPRRLNTTHCKAEGLGEAVGGDQGISLPPDFQEDCLCHAPAAGPAVQAVSVCAAALTFPTQELAFLLHLSQCCKEWWHLPKHTAFSPAWEGLELTWRVQEVRQKALKILLKHHQNDLKYPSPAWIFGSKISISKPWRDKRSFCLLNPLLIDSGYQLSQLNFSCSNTCISLEMPRSKGYLGIRGVNSFPEALKQI